MQICKIVVTGGPCGGKSTAASRIDDHFSPLGYRVIFVSEAATELILGGIAPWVGSNVEFQKSVLRSQRSKESIYADWAHALGDEKILIVCDRGALDNKAYMSQDEFDSVLESLGLNEVELRDGYDAVFHLVTAANGAEEFYTLENNTARTESIEEAVELDNKLIAAWTGHPHLRVIDNSTGFNEKINRLIAEIAGFLGEPVPMEIERKFLIRMPDLSALESMANCTKVDIIQTYLCTDSPDVELRLRQRGINGNYIFIETTKRRISNMRRMETERRLKKEEYLTLLMNADTSLKQIRKTRYCLSYNNLYLELDVFPFWEKHAILEIELADENQPINIPNFIHLIREVTDEKEFTNHSIASHVPEITE